MLTNISMSNYREQIDGIFYINLDHRTDRKEEIERELTRFDLKFERFPAIPHKIGGVGCGTSHLEVIKLAKQRGYRNVLIFEDDIEFIVDKALEFKLGARGLRAICENIMNDAMFELPSNNSNKPFRVTAEFVETKFRKTSMARLKVA